VESPITIRRSAGGVVEIVPHGEIDLDNAHELREAVDTAFTTDEPRLIRVDMLRVRFIDSAGVAALVGGYHTAAVRGARLVVTNPNQFVYRQLYISGLVGLFGAPRPRVVTEDQDEPVG
jgi:anti-sigma B factor antagonist